MYKVGKEIKKNTIIKMMVIMFVMSMFFSYTHVAAYDVQYESYAQALKEIDVFKGTDLGFELERAPSRVEGGVMLVRLLGGESEALAKNYDHPFMDVPSWADPYIGYLYKHELTKGISDSMYGSSLPLQAKSFMTFVLRALGYKESLGDFTWDNALEYAFSLELISQSFYTQLSSDDFVRDHVAKLSYDALFLPMKGIVATLGEKLVSQGAISKVSANTIGIIDEYFMNNADSASIYGVSVGAALDEVINIMGDPDDVLPSRWGFDWYIYHFDYMNYVQIGMAEQKVVAFYTNSAFLRTDKEMSLGNDKEEIVTAYISPVNYIEKKVEGDQTTYLYYPKENNSQTFLLSDFKGYITYYYDSFNNHQAYAAFVIDKELEESYITPYLVDKELISHSINIQTLYITNAIRAIHDKEALLWEEKAHLSAAKHCQDMIDRDFFSHINPDGESPFSRMNNEGIYYSLAGENIAYGFYDAIESVQAWYNSKTGHRENLMDDYEYLGVGNSFKNDSMYITQNFWR